LLNTLPLLRKAREGARLFGSAIVAASQKPCILSKQAKYQQYMVVYISVLSVFWIFFYEVALPDAWRIPDVFWPAAILTLPLDFAWQPGGM
jgi:hypothetical protein